jgi:hypothetical protein
MVTDPEKPQFIEELGSKVLAALGRIEGMEVELEGLKVRLRQTEATIIAAEHRRLAYNAALIGFGRPRDPARRVADAEWRPVEAAARRALEEEDEWRRVQEAGQRVLEEEN